MSAKPDLEKRALIVSLDKQGMNLTKIGERLGIGRDAVRKHLRKAGSRPLCPSEMPGYKPKKPRPRREASDHRSEREVIIPPNIVRHARPAEPCFFCGVRPDVPCRHRSAS